jgi:hypothetical protein
MSGDDLSVFLFCLGLAVTFFIEGLNRERIGRVIFWLSAGIMVGSALFWPQIEVNVPKTALFIRSIAIKPLGWFFVFTLFLMVIITGKGHKQSSSTAPTKVGNTDSIPMKSPVLDPIFKHEPETITTPKREQKTLPTDLIVQQKAQVSRAVQTDRDYCHKSVEQLMSMFDNNVERVALQLIEPQIGTWMNLAGVITGYYEIGDNILVQMDRKEGRPVSCIFLNEHGLRIFRLNKGDSIKVEGQIAKYQNGTLLRLENCELAN